MGAGAGAGVFVAGGAAGGAARRVYCDLVTASSDARGSQGTYLWASERAAFNRRLLRGLATGVVGGALTLRGNGYDASGKGRGRSGAVDLSVQECGMAIYTSVEPAVYGCVGGVLVVLILGGWSERSV